MFYFTSFYTAISLFSVFFFKFKQISNEVQSTLWVQIKLHSPPPSAEVKEKVEPYLYSPYGPSWPTLG
jgi:hypothetical protein